MKSSSSQLSLHIPAKAVCLSFAGSRMSLSFQHGNELLEEQRGIPGALQCKTLAALKAPVAWNMGTTYPTEDRFILWVSKCFPSIWLPVQAFAIFPGLPFDTHFFHSFAASYFSLVSVVSRNLPWFNFTRILTIEIHPIMYFKANLNNSSSVLSCELLTHLTQIMVSAGMKRNLLNENQFLPESLFHPCNIFKCKFED